MIRHIVFVRFRAGLPPGEVAALMRGLDGLRAVLPGLLAVSGGANVSHEGLGQGYTHAFVCDFSDASARDAYLAHPDHVALGARIVAATEGGLDGLAVVDVASS